MRAGPVELRDGDLALLLYLLHRGIPIETTGLDPLLLQDLPHLADCEILGYVGGKPQVRLPILSPDEYGALEEIRLRHTQRWADFFTPLLSDARRAEAGASAHLEGRVPLSDAIPATRYRWRSSSAPPKRARLPADGAVPADGAGARGQQCRFEVETGLWNKSIKLHAKIRICAKGAKAEKFYVNGKPFA